MMSPPLPPATARPERAGARSGEAGGLGRGWNFHTLL